MDDAELIKQAREGYQQFGWFDDPAVSKGWTIAATLADRLESLVPPPAAPLVPGDAVICVDSSGSYGALKLNKKYIIEEIDERGYLHLVDTEDPESNWGGGWNVRRFTPEEENKVKQPGFHNVTGYGDTPGMLWVLVDDANPYRFRLEFTYPDGTRTHKTVDFTKKE